MCLIKKEQIINYNDKIQWDYKSITIKKFINKKNTTTSISFTLFKSLLLLSNGLDIKKKIKTFGTAVTPCILLY